MLLQNDIEHEKEVYCAMEIGVGYVEYFELIIGSASKVNLVSAAREYDLASFAFRHVLICYRRQTYIHYRIYYFFTRMTSGRLLQFCNIRLTAMRMKGS